LVAFEIKDTGLSKQKTTEEKCSLNMQVLIALKHGAATRCYNDK